MGNVAEKITIICDSREQDSLSFDSFKGVEVVRNGLKTGDYSIQGYESQFCIERKSVPDVVGTLISGHSRFLREMERMKDFEEKYILVEHSAGTVYRYCERHGWCYKFDTIMQSLLAYAYHFQVRVRFCKNREDMAEYIVKKGREFIQKKGEQNDQPKETDNQDS